jgi:hypothetical protein
VNDFHLCADSSTGSGMMPKSEYSYYLMQGIPKDDDWRFFTQLMYDKIDTIADKPGGIVTKITPTKRDYRRKTIRRWQPCSQSYRRRVIDGTSLRTLGSPVVVAVREMVVVRRMRSIAVAMLRCATDAIRWGTLHGIVQALHRWRAAHRKRQWQRQLRRRRHQLGTIG